MLFDRQDGFYPSDKLLHCHSETCPSRVKLCLIVSYCVCRGMLIMLWCSFINVMMWSVGWGSAQQPSLVSPHVWCPRWLMLLVVGCAKRHREHMHWLCTENYWDHLRNILMGGTMWHIIITHPWYWLMWYDDIFWHIVTYYYIILLRHIMSDYYYVYCLDVILLLIPSCLRECWMHLVVARLAKAKRFYHSPPVPLNVLLGILSRWGFWRLEDREPELLAHLMFCVLEGNHTVWVHHQQTLEVNYI